MVSSNIKVPNSNNFDSLWILALRLSVNILLTLKYCGFAQDDGF